MLSACGGGSSDSTVSPGASVSAQAVMSQQTADQPYTDPVAYSSNANDGLPASQVSERAAVMHHQWTSGKTAINYVTTTGHLTASDARGNPEATISYVAYTAPATGKQPRPLTFFYNGGPGSSSVWLRLGSFAPTRVATPDPMFGNWPNYPLVDNADSLIDTTDMVFIDPPGTGLSEAILPNTNRNLWGSDPDVNVIRDFIIRYLATNNRSGSPIYLYGESYGAPRTDMAALALESAGVHLTGIVLQSSILNYFADAIEATLITRSAAGLKLDTDTLAGHYPTYAEIAAYYNQTSRPIQHQGLFALQSEAFATGEYDRFKNYALSWVLSEIGTPNAFGAPVLPSTQTLESWQWSSSLTLQALQGYFSVKPFVASLLPGTIIGRYDGRVSLPNSDPRLQADSDPSDILIAQPFTNVLATQMPSYLGYTAPNATYVLLNNSIMGLWDFSHEGQPLPDTLPDLLGAITLNPKLKVLSENGYHDLATPFFTTEKELARLQTVSGLNPNIQINFFQGGHMIYLDDVARPQMRSDLVDYYHDRKIPLALSLSTLPAPWMDDDSVGTPVASE
ncbi:peptidase S10 [Paraburkholderia sp. NMBU_R16]|uniref:S10 family serine carboxypeptidase-like protein n=1 Tax=Paraburkholderia sp. NMBU_R16 TaxID=2698676 RepID=UPI0020B752AD|nr:peptidase S10 [Paraburkholderia sp. NMBU_R16]